MTKLNIVSASDGDDLPFIEETSTHRSNGQKMSCYQVVFACAFGAALTTQKEASCNNMETGPYLSVLSAYRFRTTDLNNNILTGLLKSHLNIMAQKLHEI